MHIYGQNLSALVADGFPPWGIEIRFAQFCMKTSRWGSLLLLQDPQQCIVLLVQWTSWNIICCVAKAFGKIGAKDLYVY